MKNLTLQDIVNRKIQYIKNRSPEEKIDFEIYDRGSLKASVEILSDIETLDENAFVKKYLDFIQANKETKFILEEEIEEFDGYNNFIVSVLMLLNPIYEYDLDD
ncbi:hypothetical protein QI30_15875 [Kurthia sp. 3B1D]|uniref:Uncharacterized protein n=1 Tax=Candidatus Kurthia intestinigallinarum TaxID=1562256 RepID=A0A433RQI0_9BACL|nr:hypothetical protein [Kurthia sp. 3B1D]RUS53035.1 hypothetical protein QI30_15875 [Kurthia sp. 3B1D]